MTTRKRRRKRKVEGFVEEEGEVLGAAVGLAVVVAKAMRGGWGWDILAVGVLRFVCLLSM